MSKRSRSEKSKTPESSSNPFISQNASHRFSVIHNKHVISGRTVVLADFEHLNLTTILSTSSLKYLVSIKEPVYPELVHYFYSNLTFQNNHLRSRGFGHGYKYFLRTICPSVTPLLWGGRYLYCWSSRISILMVKLPSSHLCCFIKMKTLLLLGTRRRSTILSPLKSWPR